MHDSNNLVDLFKLMTKGGGYVHRGDINYNGGYIGLPLGSDADIMTPLGTSYNCSSFIPEDELKLLDKLNF